jgi:hypothetical protein
MIGALTFYKGIDNVSKLLSQCQGKADHNDSDQDKAAKQVAGSSAVTLAIRF